MSSYREPAVTFLPGNRLAKILSGMDRKTFAEHVQNAEKEVERVAPTLRESIEGDVQSLTRLCRQDEAEVFGQCREIGWLTLRIVECAHLAGKPELAETAKGVWEMIEALSDRGVWHTDALRMHVEAMQALMSGAPAAAEGTATMMKELLKMREAVGAVGAMAFK